MSVAGEQLRIVWKNPCRLATTADHGLTGLAAIDGVTPSAGNRILVWQQTTASQNGIYVAAAGAWTRALDMDTSTAGTDEVKAGLSVFVEDGASNGRVMFTLMTKGTITLGTTSLTFRALDETHSHLAILHSNQLSAGNGISSAIIFYFPGANPSSGNSLVLTDGTTTRTYGFGTGGDVTVTIGGSSVLTMQNLATSITGDGSGAWDAVYVSGTTLINAAGLVVIYRTTQANNTGDRLYGTFTAGIAKYVSFANEVSYRRAGLGITFPNVPSADPANQEFGPGRSATDALTGDTVTLLLEQRVVLTLDEGLGVGSGGTTGWRPPGITYLAFVDQTGDAPATASGLSLMYVDGDQIPSGLGFIGETGLTSGIAQALPGNWQNALLHADQLRVNSNVATIGGATIFWLVTNPSTGDTLTVTDGSTTRTYGAGTGGDVQYTIGGSVSATLDNLVAAINGDGSSAWGAVHSVDLDTVSPSTAGGTVIIYRENQASSSSDRIYGSATFVSNTGVKYIRFDQAVDYRRVGQPGGAQTETLPSADPGARRFGHSRQAAQLFSGDIFSGILDGTIRMLSKHPTTDAWNSQSPLTTKGDLYGRTASTDARVAVAANGLVLTADSTATTGVSWQAVTYGTNTTFSTLWNPKVPPSSPHAKDDEFGDSSFDTGKWTEFDPPSILTITEDSFGAKLAFTDDPGATDSIVGARQAIPSSDEFEIVTRVTVHGVVGNFTFGGIFLAGDIATSPTTAPIFTAGFRIASGGFDAVEAVNWTNRTTYSSTASGVESRTDALYLALQWKVSTGRACAWFSYSGVDWTRLTTASYDPTTVSTVSFIGLCANGTDQAGNARFEFFRVREAGSGILDVAPPIQGTRVAVSNGARAGSGTDNRVVRWDGTQNLQDSLVSVSDTGLVAGAIGYQATEQTTAPSTTAGQGTFWVRDDVPSAPLFTDDTGADYHLLNWNPLKRPCRVATTGNIASLSTGAPSTVDGVSVAVNNRVLVWNQTTASQNGIYQVDTVGTGADGVWSRAADFNSVAKDHLTAGIETYIQEGDLYGRTRFTLVTTGVITLGTTSLEFIPEGGLARTDAISTEVIASTAFTSGTFVTSSTITMRDHSELAVYFDPTNLGSNTIVDIVVFWSDDGTTIPFATDDNIQQSDFDIVNQADGSYNPKPYTARLTTAGSELVVNQKVHLVFPKGGGAARIGVKGNSATGAFSVRTQRLVS